VRTRLIRVLALATYPYEAAASRYRIIQYESPLRARGIDLVFRPFLDGRTFATLYDRKRIAINAVRLAFHVARRVGDLFRAFRADVVFVQREALLFGPPVFEFIVARLLHRPMVLDLDDATYLPARSVAFGRLAELVKARWKTDAIIRWSRSVVCGNEAIAQHVRAAGVEAVVLKTIVNLHSFRARPPGDRPGLPVVGWVGSHSTWQYVAPLLPTLARVARDYPFTLRIVGAGPVSIEEPGLATVSAPWSLEREPADFASLDIGLYPLAEDDWAAAKSGLKAIQYMSVGVPFVVTPVGICATLGETGRTHLEARTHDDWFQALSELLSDTDRRRTMGRAGRQYAMANFSLELQADVLADVLRQAAVRGRSE
jgi:glycosyltransferase involved in cell wall biosynthesis